MQGFVTALRFRLFSVGYDSILVGYFLVPGNPTRLNRYNFTDDSTFTSISELLSGGRSFQS